MNKKLIAIGITLVFLMVGLSGCFGNNDDETNGFTDNEPTETQNNDSQTIGDENEGDSEQSSRDRFRTAMESIAGDFVDESSGYNSDTSQVEIDYILRYSQTEFDKHSSLIYENDGVCNNNDYSAVRDDVIEGLQYLVDKEYYEAWSSFLAADCEIFDVNIYGDMWDVQFGFEDGVVDILFDMGYFGDYFEWGN